MKNILALILCGGAGTRLAPLTDSRAKPAVPLLGQYKLVDIPISSCLHSGINQIFALTQFNSAGLNHHIAESYRINDWGRGFVRVLAAEQRRDSYEWFGGTADAVRQVLHHMDQHPHSHVLILAGDQVYNMDFSSFYQQHLSNDAALSIATTPVTKDQATALGIMKTDPNGAIVQFVEKPSSEALPELRSEVSETARRAGKEYLASTGIYLFNKDFLKALLLESTFMDFGKEVIPHAIKAQLCYSYAFSGYWNDVGTVRSYHEANLALARMQPVINMYNSNRRYAGSGAPPLPPPRIHGTYLNDAVVSNGSCLIQSKIYNCVLGPMTFVGARSTLKDTIVFGADHYRWEAYHDPDIHPVSSHPGIGEGCYIEGAIIDQNVHIGDGVVLSNQDNVLEGEGENYFIRDGIIVIPKNTIIPAGTVIGARNKNIQYDRGPAEFMPPALPLGVQVHA